MPLSDPISHGINVAPGGSLGEPAVHTVNAVPGGALGSPVIATVDATPSGSLGNPFEHVVSFDPAPTSSLYDHFAQSGTPADTGALFDHVVVEIPGQSTSSIFDHEMEVLVAGIPGKQIGTGARGIATANIVDSAVTNVKIANGTIDISKFNTTTQNAITAGKTWKELLLASQQVLGGASGGVLQAMLIAFDGNPVATDTFILTDGTTTETFTFQAGASAGFGVQVQGTAALTLAELVARINANSTLWSALDTTQLVNYFAGAYANQAVVYRTLVSVAADRIHGVVTTATDIKVVEFATGDQDYAILSGTESNIPAADPAAKRFGFGRVEASLVTNETHLAVENNGTYTWDDNDQLWRQTDVGAVDAGAGLAKSTNTINLVAAANADGAAVTVNANDFQIDGDLINIDQALTNITPDTGGTGVDVADLASIILGIDNALGGAVSAQPTTSNKNMTASVTTIDGDQATATTVAATPSGDGYVAAGINGVLYTVGDAVKTTDGYFSSDGGTTAKAISAIAAADTFHWNQSVAGFNLDASDRVDFYYNV